MFLFAPPKLRKRICLWSLMGTLLTHTAWGQGLDDGQTDAPRLRSTDAASLDRAYFGFHAGGGLWHQGGALGFDANLRLGKRYFAHALAGLGFFSADAALWLARAFHESPGKGWFAGVGVGYGGYAALERGIFGPSFSLPFGHEWVGERRHAITVVPTFIVGRMGGEATGSRYNARALPGFGASYSMAF